MKIKCPKCGKIETPILVRGATISTPVDTVDQTLFDFVTRDDREVIEVNWQHLICGNDDCESPLQLTNGSAVDSGKTFETWRKQNPQETT